MGRKNENTNLAAEFYIMSMLHRLGLEPILTLGNKKDIDILLHTNNRTYTIDVKGLKGKTNWPIGNKEKINSFRKQKLKNHFFIFITFLGKIRDATITPEIFVVPLSDALNLKVYWGKQDQYSIEYSDLKGSNKYKDAWHYFDI
jgi:hypothetical protein